MIDFKLDSANQLYLANDFVRAKEGYLEILKEDNNNLSALHNIGLCYYNLGEFTDALDSFNRAYEHGLEESLVCRGNCYRALELYQLALADYGTALVKNYKNASAFNNYGNTLRELGEPVLAIPFLQASQILDPSNTTAKFNEAVAHLLAGNLLPGWEKYESRWDYEHQKGLKPQFNNVPEWDGTQDLNGKTILLYSEQGYGDTLQFCRYVLPLQDKHGAKVILVTRPELTSLFGSNPNMQVFSTNESLPPFDYHCALLGLPKAFKTTLNTIPSPIKYLSANERRVQKWRRELGPKLKMRVGITWSGLKESWINRYKSMPLEKVLELVTDEHQFVCLQKDITESDKALLEKYNVTVISDQLVDFHETAAVISNLDVVITVDTSVAHLSGGLGVPTWIMLNNYAVDWRWLLNRNDSPWYPTARLFRQSSPGDWTSVIQEIKQHLKLFKI